MPLQSSDVLRVLEHEPVPVTSARLPGERSLTEEEADWLLRLNESRRGFCKREFRQVRFAHFCGIVRLPTRTIEIYPKTTVCDAVHGSADNHEIDHSRMILLRMLGHLPHFPFSQVGTAAQRPGGAPLLEVFIHHFLVELAVLVRRGLLAVYVEQQDNSPMLRGRLALAQHLRVNYGRPDRLLCNFDELTSDNLYNRVIRQVLQAVNASISASSVRQLWNELWPIFELFEPLRYTPSQVAALPRNRMTQHYHGILVWCEWLLGLQSPAMLAGSQEAPALLFNMHALFEAYVAACAHKEYAYRNMSVTTKGPVQALALDRNATGTFDLLPDVLVTEHGAQAPRLIIDAKWKVLDPTRAYWAVSEKDMYQMLAYAIRYGCSDIRLAYPWLDGLPDQADWPTYRIPLGHDNRHVTVMVHLYPIEDRPAS